MDPDTPDPSPPPWECAAIVRKAITLWQQDRNACARWLATFPTAQRRTLAGAVVRYRQAFYPESELTADRLCAEWRRAIARLYAQADASAESYHSLL